MICPRRVIVESVPGAAQASPDKGNTPRCFHDPREKGRKANAKGGIGIPPGDALGRSEAQTAKVPSVARSYRAADAGRSRLAG